MLRRWKACVGSSACVLMVCVSVASAQAPVPSGTNPPPEGVNQRISLDLKGVDILDVLKLLSQKSGLNFVAGRNVSGRVTMFVNDVDVWEAFELIVGANDLAYERHGDIVTVMMARDYELLYGERFQERTRNLVVPLRYAKALQVTTVLNQIKSNIGRVIPDEATNTLVITDMPSQLEKIQGVLKELDRPIESHVYNLNYADAEKLKEKVQERLSPAGTFTFDARTNKVVVTDLPENLTKIGQIIQAFDAPEGEVLIEAKIINVQLNDDFNLGVDWQRVFAGVDAATRSNFDVISGDIVTGTVTGSALKIVGSTNNDSKVIIEALKKITKTETLASPRIMVAHNQEARILVGTKEAFITVTTTVPATGSTVSSPQIQFVDVGTKLYVTPNVKRDGRIQLKIRPEVSATTSTVTTSDGNRIPIVSTTEAETNVLVKSGVTVIIGGLIETKNSFTDNRTPVLGDLPVIGMAFRGKADTKKKTELVVFLTPQIVMPDGSLFTPPTEVKPIAEQLIQEVRLQDPVPNVYRQAVRQRLQEQLKAQFRAASLPAGSVTVSFIINHEGQLVGEPEITSSQGERFISAAHLALAQAQPFPSFPDGSSANEVRFRMAVEYVPD